MRHGKYQQLHRGHILFIDYQYNKLRDGLQDLEPGVRIAKYERQSQDDRNRRIYNAVMDGWLYVDIAVEHGITPQRVCQIVRNIKRAITRDERMKELAKA